MKVLKGILRESKDYYLDAKRKIEKKLESLPCGSIKQRNISGKKYYYLQMRKGKKVIHKYLGKKEPQEMLAEIKKRRALKKELKKVNEALKILIRTEDKKRGKNN